MTQLHVGDGSALQVVQASPESPPGTGHDAPDQVDGPPGPDGDETALPSRGNRVRMVVGVLLGTWFTAMGCNAIIEVLQSGGDVHRLLTYTLDEARLIFLLSTGLIWATVLAVTALVGRLWVTVGLFTAFATLVGFATYQKTVLRQEPIYPSDLAFAGQAGFLRQMVSPRLVVMVLAVVVLVLVIAVLFGRLMARIYPPVRRRAEPRRWRALLGARLAVLVAVALVFAYVGGFNDPGNGVRTAYEKAGAHWAFWFQKVNYARNGFVGGFLYNLPGPAMAEPEDYSAETMAELTRKYAAEAARLNQGRSAGALDDVNIVLVLSEALSDPTTIDGPTYEDPIPFIRELMGRTRSGTMLPQLFGGGTANMEFEVLTGMSLSQFLPQLNTPYQQLVTETPTFPSAVGYLRAQGHRPIGVHPYMTTMYKRYAVYPTLGFESFVDDKHMQEVERIGDEDAFISDASAFDEVLHQLQESEEPALVNLVTMQNHYPFEGRYEDPVPVEGIEGEVADQLSNYLRGLQLTDAALERFLASLSRSEEKTAVVMYGDHAPAFWSGDVYDANGEDAFRRTPYLMWTNFKRLPDAENALTSPIFFLPTLLDDLGAPLPPYYALLSELQTEIAAMEQGEYHLPDGRQVSEDELGERAQELLHDYRLVQYDLAVGERYSQAGLFYPQG